MGGGIQQQLAPGKLVSARPPTPPPPCLCPLAGPKREMKKALEAYWSGAIDGAALLASAGEVEAGAWRAQADVGIDRVGLDGTLYDQLLDTTFQLGLIPLRFKVGGASWPGSPGWRAERRLCAAGGERAVGGCC